MFIPIGHSETSVRRWPWVTFAIMGLCLVAFLVTRPGTSAAGREAHFALEAIKAFYMLHPELELDPRVEDQVFEGMPNRQGERDAMKEFLEESQGGFGFGGFEDDGHRIPTAELQAQLDELQERYLDAETTNPYAEFGLIPAHPKPTAWITHMFMHGGWGHLIFNLLFLYLAGPYVEDKWGRFLFLAFYLGGGLISAVVYVTNFQASEGALIGASGAIAAVMGAFLIRFSNTQIRFLYFFFFTPRVVDFPAWLMLPIWVLREFFMAQAVTTGMQSGVAHVAHVAGFLVGMAVGFIIGKSGIEKHRDAAMERGAIKYDNPKLEEALTARAQGQLDQAAAMLREVVDTAPDNPDAVAALWDVERDRENTEAAVTPMLRAVQAGIRNGDTSLLESHWEDVVAQLKPGDLPPVMAAKILEAIRGTARADVLRQTVDVAAGAVDDQTPLGILHRLARAGGEFRASSTAALADRALEAAELPPDVAVELRAIREAAPPPEAVHATPSVPPVPQPDDADAGAAPEEPTFQPPPLELPGRKDLEVIDAIPVQWQAGVLTVDVQGNRLQLNANQIQAMAVAGIAQEGAKPYVLVDLLLDAPWGERQKLRCVRMLGNSFDPRSLAVGENAMESFRRFLGEVLEASEAAPLPDPDGARGNPFRKYDGLEQYQDTVLNAGT
jgi:membrane associated rhomboid family serine protease